MEVPLTILVRIDIQNMFGARTVSFKLCLAVAHYAAVIAVDRFILYGKWRSNCWSGKIPGRFARR